MTGMAWYLASVTVFLVMNIHIIYIIIAYTSFVLIQRGKSKSLLDYV